MITYFIKIEIISRGNTRKGYWSTKRVREKIIGLGYDIEGANPSKPINQLIQVVALRGTKQEVTDFRDDIICALKSVAGCRVPIKIALYQV